MECEQNYQSVSCFACGLATIDPEVLQTVTGAGRLYPVIFRQTTRAATPSTLERTRKCTTTGDNDYDNDEDRDDDTMTTPSCDLMDRAVAGNTERGGQVSCDWSTGHNTDL